MGNHRTGTRYPDSCSQAYAFAPGLHDGRLEILAAACAAILRLFDMRSMFLPVTATGKNNVDLKLA